MLPVCQSHVEYNIFSVGCELQGERLSHAVGCAFAICLEKKQAREKEKVTVTFSENGTSFTRMGSFRQTTLTERLADPQSAIVAGLSCSRYYMFLFRDVKIKFFVGPGFESPKPVWSRIFEFGIANFSNIWVVQLTAMCTLCNGTYPVVHAMLTTTNYNSDVSNVNII